MRRHKDLYGRIVSFQNLLHAAKLARRGKRFKNATARFHFFLEYELWRLHEELSSGTYRPGVYRHFTIYEPKKRVISAAPYRDRVVHHAIHNILEPIFDPTFIFDSYATRRGKGTHAAIDRFQEFARSNSYVLKCDIRQYFPSIDQDVLMGLIQKKIACRPTLSLIETILKSHHNMAADLQPASQPARSVGIPIGNLTSQFFANVYLNGLDHYVKERLGCRYYLRYMDDFVIFHDDKAFLWRMKQSIVEHLETLKVELHAGKCRIFETAHGVPFLGLTVFPERRRLKRENFIRYRRRLKKLRDSYHKGEVGLSPVRQSIQAWIGHAKHADTARLRKFLLGDIVF